MMRLYFCDREAPTFEAAKRAADELARAGIRHAYGYDLTNADLERHDVRIAVYAAHRVAVVTAARATWSAAEQRERIATKMAAAWRANPEYVSLEPSELADAAIEDADAVIAALERGVADDHR